jgi:hypothetical protein
MLALARISSMNKTEIVIENENLKLNISKVGFDDNTEKIIWNNNSFKNFA